MLSEKEISDCLNEHKFFIDKYIADNCKVCYTTRNKPTTNCVVDLGTPERDRLSKAFVEPSRAAFFSAVAEAMSGVDNLKILEIGVSTGANAKLIYEVHKYVERVNEIILDNLFLNKYF